MFRSKKPKKTGVERARQHGNLYLQYANKDYNLTKFYLELSNFDPLRLNYLLSLSVIDFYEHLTVMSAETKKRRDRVGREGAFGKGIN